jgi:hypothetical protein
VRTAWRIGAAIVAAALLVGLGLVVTDTARLGGTSPALAPRDRVRSSSGPAAGDSCPSPLTVSAPLRVWIGGDSLAGSIGPTLAELLASTGVVSPTWDSRVSSGLSTPDFFDWPRHAAAEMTRLDPEVVVFIIGTNDWRVPYDGMLNSSGAPAWKAKYAALVDQLLDVLSADGRIVYWIGGPTLGDPDKDRGVAQVDAVAESVVDQRANATYVDAYRLFGDKDGKYSAILPGVNGKQVRVRADDGIHFTAAGALVLASRLLGLVDARCQLTRQADPDRPQRVTQTPGATQVPVDDSGASSETPSSTSSTSPEPPTSSTSTSSTSPSLPTSTTSPSTTSTTAPSTTSTTT